MRISHEEYLRLMLDSRKSQLEEEMIEHRIRLAKHELKKEMLKDQIYSIERQLEIDESEE